jgi:DNA (cytosine-5)-methyltransferase 1
MTPLTVISLYTGAGGLDFGFEAAGYRTAVALELDGDCVSTLRANRSWPVIDGDVLKVTTSDLLNRGQIARGGADVLVGGPPCQPFSKSGYWASGDSRRLLDPRASTLGAYLRVLEEARPKAFLLENVEGLGYRGKEEGLSLIQQGLSRINALHGTSYAASVATLNAADFGVPQIRRRLFIVGARDGTPFEFPKPTHFDPTLSEGPLMRPYATVWDALHDLPVSSNEDLRVRGKWGDLLPSIPEGQNYLWHTPRGGGLPLFGWRRRFWSFLLRLAKARPAWTLQAQPGPATGPFHWAARRLSVREMCRLQTIPDDVQIIGSHAAAQKQLGNAVPSLLAEVLAREIARQLLGRSPSSRPKLALSAAKIPCPPPEPVTEVPSRFVALQGHHAPHPGTGLGHRASRRGKTEEQAELPGE